MAARFNDGKSARTHVAEVAFRNGVLHILADGGEHAWPLKGLSVVREADEVRLRHARNRDARLTLSEDEWDALGAPDARSLVRVGARREVVLVGGLLAMAAATAAFVFWGVPAASGPLARATPIGFEKRMGANFDAQLGAVFRTCQGADGQAAVAALGDRIAAQTDTPFDIRVRAVNAPLINAFALPGGTVLLTDDLIRELESPDELSAVIAHEVTHIEQRHVMQSVWRNLGIGMVLDLVVGGGSGAGQQAVILAGQATQLSYGRDAEVEADRRGQALLHSLGLSSEGMAVFFERLAKLEGQTTQSVDEASEFLSTHPDTARRVKLAREAQRPGRPSLTDQEWAAVKATCEAPVQTSR